MRRISTIALGILIGSFIACSTAELKTAPGGGSSSGDPPSEDDSGTTDPDGGPSPLVDPDGGTIPVTHAVTIQVMPSDSGAAIENAIKTATKSVHMTMYLLSDSVVITALKNLKTAGKDVKVVLNQNFPTGQTGSNDNVFNTLKSAGVNVVWAPAGYTYTHAKTVIIDASKVLVMTMNLTQSSPDSNREYIATDTDPQDVADAETIFAADFANQSVTLNGKLLFSPRTTSTPDAQTRLVALIGSAKKSLDVEGETLSDTKITDALVAAQTKGVTVRVVIDAQTGTAAQQTAVTKLKAAGVAVKSLGSPTMHAKAIVSDGTLAYVGSINFTANSLFDNREVGLITDAASEVTKVSSTIATDFSAGTAL